MKKLASALMTIYILYVFTETILGFAIMDKNIGNLLFDMEPYSSKLLEIKWEREDKERVSFEESGFKFDKGIGWAFSKKPSSYTEKNGTMFNINKYGNRITGKDLNSNMPLIAILGDSFAFGSEVNNEFSLPFLLNTNFPKAQSLNLATPAYGHGQMYLSYKEHPLKTKFKYTVLIFLETDMYRNVMNFRDFAKPSFNKIKDKLEIDYSNLISPEQRAQKGSSSVIAGIINLISNYLNADFQTDGLVETSHSILKKMKEESIQNGSEFIVIFAPQLSLDHEKKKVHTQNYYNLGTNKDMIGKLHKRLNKDGILFHDIRKDILENYLSGTNYYTEKNGEHWSVQANADIAKIVTLKLKAQYPDL